MNARLTNGAFQAPPNSSLQRTAPCRLAAELGSFGGSICGIAVWAVVFLMLLPRVVRGDAVGYDSVRTLEVVGNDYIVLHHHDWSEGTRKSRYAMITGHQDPFRADNDYAYLEWRNRSDGTVFARSPCPPLTWLGITKDQKYFIGLSDLKIWNPIQVVVYDARGRLLFAAHIGDSGACLSKNEFHELQRKYRSRFRFLRNRSWMVGERVFVDYLVIDPKHLGKLWNALYAHDCRSPWSPNITESVTNSVEWYYEDNPNPTIVEKNGVAVAIRLKDVKGLDMEIPFEVPRP
jgi:hypothetical protein